MKSHKIAIPSSNAYLHAVKKASGFLIDATHIFMMISTMNRKTTNSMQNIMAHVRLIKSIRCQKICQEKKMKRMEINK